MKFKQEIIKTMNYFDYRLNHRRKPHPKCTIPSQFWPCTWLNKTEFSRISLTHWPMRVKHCWRMTFGLTFKYPIAVAYDKNTDDATIGKLTWRHVFKVWLFRETNLNLIKISPFISLSVYFCRSWKDLTQSRSRHVLVT